VTSPVPDAVEGLGPKALNSAVLRVRDERGDPVGLAFLVTDELAVTCAHVVSAALGTAEDERPGTFARLRVDLPLLPAGAEDTSTEASIEHWVPSEDSGGRDATTAAPGDVAVLKLVAPLPGARPIRLVEAQDVWEHPARAFGFPAGRSGGVWHSGLLRSRQANGWVQVDLAGTGYRVSGGFSGSPVWDEKLVGVVGMMVVAESGEPPVSYLIPTDGLLAAWPPLRRLTVPPSPFRSLSAFQESDAAVFHGRAGESDELAAIVTAEQWVCLVGPSGSGKSSLALAGAVPRLRAAGYAVAVLRPASGSSPLSALAAALLPMLEPDSNATERLTRLPALTGVLAGTGLADIVPRVLERAGDEKLTIIVDQFEELLAQESYAIEALADVLFTELPEPVHVLTTLRADFLDSALAHPRLAPALRRRVYALGPMDPGKLREIVTTPVEAVPGVAYEAGLVDRILTDTGGEPGALPLLGFTLDLLWRQQNGGLLTHQAYTDLGGVAGALSTHADRVWSEYVPASAEPAARRLFSRLIGLPVGSAAVTRRTALRTELGEGEWRIAERLATTRLLVTGRSAEGVETAELAHEALITGWGRLDAWVTEDRSFLGWRESLRHDLDRWEHSDRSPDLLPTDSLLETAQRWLRERGTYLSDAERDYLERGRLHRRSRVRRRRGLFSGLAVLVALALTLGSLAFYQRRVSADRDALANSRALVQASADAVSQDPVQAVMLALAAYRTSPTQEARSALLRAYITRSTLARGMSGLLGKIGTIQASRDGKVVLARSDLGRATLFTRAANGQIHQRQLETDRNVIYPLVAPDGKRIGFVDSDGALQWYDVRNPDTGLIGGPHRLPAAGEVAASISQNNGAAFSADGRRVVSQSGDASSHLVWWNLDTGTLAGRIPVPANTDRTVWFGPDDTTVLTGLVDKSERVSAVAVDLTTGVIRPVVTEVDQYEVSGDGTAVSSCRRRGDHVAVAAERVTDHTSLGHDYRARVSGCELIATDDSGTRVVLGRGTPRLIDLNQGKAVSRGNPLPSGGDEYYPHLAWSDDRLFLIGNTDRLIAYAELPIGAATPETGHPVLTRTGDRMISMPEDGSRLQLRSTNGKELLAESPRAKPYWVPQWTAPLLIAPLKFSGDGTLFADREGKNLVSVREVRSLREKALITVGDVSKFNYFFDWTGRLVTVSGTQIRQWDPSTGRLLGGFDAAVFHPKAEGDGDLAMDVTFYPGDDQVAVLVQGDPLVRIVSLRTSRITATTRVPSDALTVAYESSGRYFAMLRRGSVIELWRRHPLRRELGPLPSVGTNGFVAHFTDRQGHYLLAANNSVRVYRVGSHAYQDSYDLNGAPDVFSELDFLDASTDGRTLLYTDDDTTLKVLTLDPATWENRLCQIIGYRNFTPDERTGLPVHIPAGPVCPSPGHSHD
jgi:WD40 repeat protein